MRPTWSALCAAVLLLVNPFSLTMVEYAWIEPMLILTFCLTVFSVTRYPRVVPCMFGHFLYAKQTDAQQILPLAWVLVDSANGWKGLAEFSCQQIPCGGRANEICRIICRSWRIRIVCSRFRFAGRFASTRFRTLLTQPPEDGLCFRPGFPSFTCRSACIWDSGRHPALLRVSPPHAALTLLPFFRHSPNGSPQLLFFWNWNAVLCRSPFGRCQRHLSISETRCRLKRFPSRGTVTYQMPVMTERHNNYFGA